MNGQRLGLWVFQSEEKELPNSQNCPTMGLGPLGGKEMFEPQCVARESCPRKEAGPCSQIPLSPSSQVLRFSGCPVLPKAELVSACSSCSSTPGWEPFAFLTCLSCS